MSEKKTKENKARKQKPATRSNKKADPWSEEDPRAGFYSKVLDEAEKTDFQRAAGEEGLDDEITLLRVKIKALLKHDPKNIELLMAATNILTKLVKARYSMNKKEEKSLGESIKNIIQDIAIPLGAVELNKKPGPKQ